jgi:primosomal protein N'
MPPFSHQALICANAKVKQNAQDFLQEMANLLKSIKMDSVEIWGPVTPVMVFLRVSILVCWLRVVSIWCRDFLSTDCR